MKNRRRATVFFLLAGTCWRHWWKRTREAVTMTNNGYGGFRKMAGRFRGRCAHPARPGESTGKWWGRCRRAVAGRGRNVHGTRHTRFPTRPSHDGLARHTAPFRRSRGITLYGHKTNGTARLVETRRTSRATAAERIPNGISSRRLRRSPPQSPPPDRRPSVDVSSRRARTRRRRRWRWRVHP